jgi:hypothetical protein
MNTFYEPSTETECPRAEYDPAMDIPEPTAPRRKPPFVTSRNEHGQIHRLKGRNIFTGKHVYGKWACIEVISEKYEPAITCDRKSVAYHLKHLRKAAKPC